MEITSSRRIRFIAFLSCLVGIKAAAEITIRAGGGDKVLYGNSPQLVISGLQAGEQTTVHTFRRATVFPSASAPATPVLAHAEAVFTANKDGVVSVDSVAPIRGSYSGVDPLGLLWSGNRLELAGKSAEPITQNLEIADETDFIVRVIAPSLSGGRWVEKRLKLTDGADQVDTIDVSEPGLNGVFARPKKSEGKTLPSIILLHGSEGGSVAGARNLAVRFAHLGYAAFGLNYFAWPGTGISGIPQALIDVPVEELSTARAWLSRQPNVETRHVTVWGVSKGAELALVAASHFDWIDRAVGCVPSSVVWSGFGRPPAPGEVYSSWSIGGIGLPYIPYDHYEDVLNRKFSAAFVHQRSLEKATEAQKEAARIPIEGTHAKLLLLAGSKDVVWPSGLMTTEIRAELHAAHMDEKAISFIFPEASHFICGTGAETRRINPVHKPEGDDPTPEADAHASEVGWQETKRFLQTGAAHDVR